jgi:hypothetical protein
MTRVILPIDDDVLRPSNLLSITDHNNSYLIDVGFREVVATPVRIWIKVKRYLTALIRGQGGGQLECLPIKEDGRMGLMKHALKYSQGCTIKTISAIRVETFMAGDTMIKSISSVNDVQLGICGRQTLGRKNGASLMNELSTQDIGVRTTTTCRIGFFANRSHCQGIVVKKDALAKGSTNWIVASEKVEKVVWNLLKRRKNDLALIATHAKLEVVDGGVRKSFCFPMKGVTERTLDMHPSKAMNLPSRIKGTVSDRKMWKLKGMIK